MSDSVSFDRAVGYYDRTRGMSDEAARAVVAQLADDLRGRGRVLEVGVGTGLVALPLAAAGLPMIGLDLSAPMLGKLVEKAGGHAPFPLVLGDATALPFADDRFGGAVVRHVLHLIPGWERAIAELVRVLRSDGSILVSHGDIPDVWRDVMGRFLEVTGTRSMASGLDPRDETTMEDAFARAGTRRRDLAPIAERAEQSVAEFISQMGEGMHSWTWGVEETVRREAVEEVRRWTLERFGTLDPPGSRDIAIAWRAYDLPGRRS